MHFKRLKRALTKNLHFYGGQPIVALKGLRKTVEAYIIEWTTSSEPEALKVSRTQNEVTLEAASLFGGHRSECMVFVTNLEV